MHGECRCYECLKTSIDIYWSDEVKQGRDEGHEAERQERIIWMLRSFVTEDPRLQLSDYHTKPKKELVTNSIASSLGCEPSVNRRWTLADEAPGSSGCKSSLYDGVSVMA